jgi:hypothetical protein
MRPRTEIPIRLGLPPHPPENQRDKFRQIVALITVNAPQAPEILRHVAAHLLADPEAPTAALMAFARAASAGASTTSDASITIVGEAHALRVARLVIAEAGRRELQR